MVEAGVVGCEGVGEVLMVDRASAEMLEHDAEIVGVLHHFHCCLGVVVARLGNGDVEVAVEEVVEFGAIGLSDALRL